MAARPTLEFYSFRVRRNRKVSKRWTLKKIIEEYILDIDNSRTSKYIIQEFVQHICQKT